MQQIPSNSSGCREPVIILCAVITAFLGVLAFFGIRQYTDLLGPAKARNPQKQEQNIDGADVSNNPSSIELPKEQPAESGWSNVRCEPQSVVGSLSEISDTSVSMSVEKFRIVDDRTVLRVVVEPSHCCKGAYLKRPSRVYIADSDGNIYDLIEDRGALDKIFGTTPSGREIRLHEKYRYELVFPKLSYKTSFIYLQHEWFTDIKVYLQWGD
jgi:hypothetical protein